MSAGRQIRQASKKTIKNEQCGSNPPKGVAQANFYNIWALVSQGGYSWPIASWEERYAAFVSILAGGRCSPTSPRTLLSSSLKNVGLDGCAAHCPFLLGFGDLGGLSICDGGQNYQCWASMRCGRPPSCGVDAAVSVGGDVLLRFRRCTRGCGSRVTGGVSGLLRTAPTCERLRHACPGELVVLSCDNSVASQSRLVCVMLSRELSAL